MVDLQAKDLRLVGEAAKDAGIDLAATDLVASLFEQARKEGLGREGTQALFKMVQKEKN